MGPSPQFWALTICGWVFVFFSLQFSYCHLSSRRGSLQTHLGSHQLRYMILCCDGTVFTTVPLSPYLHVLPLLHILRTILVHYSLRTILWYLCLFSAVSPSALLTLHSEIIVCQISRLKGFLKQRNVLGSLNLHWSQPLFFVLYTELVHWDWLCFWCMSMSGCSLLVSWHLLHIVMCLCYINCVWVFRVYLCLVLVFVCIRCQYVLYFELFVHEILNYLVCIWFIFICNVWLFA